MKESLIYALTAALVTTLAIKAEPAHAQQASGNEVRVVQTADLDLGSAAGQRLLDIRLARAARELCGTVSDSDLVGKNRLGECREAVIAEGHRQGAHIAAASSAPTVIAVSAAR